MTPSLRSIHRRIWYALALLLPLGFIIAVISIPGAVADPGFSGHQPEAFPVVARSGGTDKYPVALRKAENQGNQFQVELTVTEPLTVPSALVYFSIRPEGGPEDGLLLGSLGSTGTHRFNLNLPETMPKALYLYLYDPVNQEVFQILKF